MGNYDIRLLETLLTPMSSWTTKLIPLVRLLRQAQKEQTRLKVLNSVLVDQVPVCQAAEVLGVSERHTRRILRAYRKEGARALSHGNRGRLPVNATDETTATAVVELARTREPLNNVIQVTYNSPWEL